MNVRAEQPIQTADAWIASTARQWRVPLVTANFRDDAAISDLDVVPIC
jgi:predicted nucleic acid-binding protein